MKEINTWVLFGSLGLIGAGCGGTGNDSAAGSEAERLTKVTSVTLNGNDKPEVKTFYATPTRIQALKQRRLDAKRRLDEGGPSEEALAPDQALAPELVLGNCDTNEALWVWDAHGASSSGSNICCLAHSMPGERVWGYIQEVCGFSYMFSLWSGSVPGYYEARGEDCRGNYPTWTQMPELICSPTDFVYMNYPPIPN